VAGRIETCLERVKVDSGNAGGLTACGELSADLEVCRYGTQGTTSGIEGQSARVVRSVRGARLSNGLEKLVGTTVFILRPVHPPLAPHLTPCYDRMQPTVFS
jgi:hypothetical protein